MLILATLIFGSIALSELSVNLLPDVDSPTLLVRTDWSGAAPREVEQRINQPLEGLLSTLRGLEDVHGFARQGQSVISLTFKWGPDMDLAFLNVREKLEQIRQSLPQDADRPDEEQVAGEGHVPLREVDQQVVVGVAGHVHELQREPPELKSVSVLDRSVGAAGGAPVGQKRSTRQLTGPGVAVRVVGVAVGVDDQLHLETLGARSIDEPVGVEGRIHQGRGPGAPIADEVAQVAIAARAVLFEDEVHARSPVTRR
jgi:hypothetical protein